MSAFAWISGLGIAPIVVAASVGATLTALLGAALVRRRRLAALLSRLDVLARVAPPVDEALAARVGASLGRAAGALGFGPGAHLPRPLLAELPLTPALVGLRQPYVLLAPSLAEALTDAELDAALRHELAHFRRRGRRSRSG